MVSKTSRINGKSFAIKKITNPTKATIKEIAYNIFMANKQYSKTDSIFDYKSSFIGSILRKDAFYIIMNKFDLTLGGVSKMCKIPVAKNKNCQTKNFHFPNHNVVMFYKVHNYSRK